MDIQLLDKLITTLYCKTGSFQCLQGKMLSSQGTILAPLLFFVHVFDTDANTYQCFIPSSTDDTRIFTEFHLLKIVKLQTWIKSSDGLLIITCYLMEKKVLITPLWRKCRTREQHIIPDTNERHHILEKQCKRPQSNNVRWPYLRRT